MRINKDQIQESLNEGIFVNDAKHYICPSRRGEPQGNQNGQVGRTDRIGPQHIL